MAFGPDGALANPLNQDPPSSPKLSARPSVIAAARAPRRKQYWEQAGREYGQVSARSRGHPADHWSTPYPLVVEAVNHLKVRSCLIGGEVACCDAQGVTSFQLVRVAEQGACPVLML
jgi:hypothetical protein